MKVKLIFLSLAILSLASCTKSVEKISEDTAAKTAGVKSEGRITSTADAFTTYIIESGKQFCNLSLYQPVKLDELAFVVKFDNSAVYQTIDPANQLDINKLWGFSDNNAQHQEFSARFGWRWSDNALRLFSYVYNNGVRSWKELGTIDIGTENVCSIKVQEDKYVFTVNGNSQTMLRESQTILAEGYKLYPYFGGDERAPHAIAISIKEL